MDLNALRTFAAVIEGGSFTAAANQLNVPLSTVSRKVALLEEQLGTRLLVRTTRHLRPTDIGEQVYAQAVALSEIHQSVGAIISEQSQKLEGRIRISAPPSLFDRFLTPLFAQFQQEHPAVQIELNITNQFLNPITDNIDLVFRIGPLPDSQLVAQRLLTFRHVLVASPSYLAQAPVLEAPADLAAHRLLTFLHAGRRKWKLSQGGNVKAITVAAHFSTNDYNGLMGLLCAGAGVGELPHIVAEEKFQAGELVAVLPGWQLPEVGLFLAHNGHRFVPRQARALIDHAVRFAKSRRKADKK